MEGSRYLGKDDERQIVAYEESSRKGRRTSFVWYPGDDELLDYIRSFLGCGKSEAVRSALRAYAMHLQSLKR